MFTVGLALTLTLAPNLSDAREPAEQVEAPRAERVWVFFTDRGRSSAQLELDLAARDAELIARARARRRRATS